MLRNVVRELERGRRMPPRALQQALLCRHSLPQGRRLYSAGAVAVQDIESSRSRLDSEATGNGQQFRERNSNFALRNGFHHATSHGVKRRPRADSPNKKYTRSSKVRRPRQLLENMPSSELIEKVLGGKPDGHIWRKRIAKFRTIRLSILLLQEVIRRDQLESTHQNGLLELLPTPEENQTLLQHPSLAGHTQQAVERCVYVLRGQNDDERCQRYLENPASIPLFIFHFLVRASSSLSDTDTLQKVIESSSAYYDGSRTKERLAEHNRAAAGRASENALDIDRANFNLMMRLLVRHCHRLEPRFVVKLADSAAQYIQNMSTLPEGERKRYITQCSLFNGCLQILQPQPHVQVAQRSTPNAYFWEAQRILLSMSADLPKPLLVDRDGFRAIREVLSGLPKNYAEVHSSTRHASSWPPYLQLGHGMDERADPEDNWSRTVSAGMLMQEAGFAKEEVDDAVDILQGMTLDGSPTIQQRAMVSKGRNMGVWEASIRATRNAQEAWDRFQHPPDEGLKPGQEQYTAMFEKLVLREVEQDSRISPGDKALNFPTQHEANLAEFERARLRPPSVSELYQHMRLNGVQPGGSCLRILVANAASLETAHQYLRDSIEKPRIVRNLLAEEPDAGQLRLVPIGLFAAYIQVCLRVEGQRRGNQLMRVIRLTESRLSQEQSRWVPFIWGTILKELSQHHKALRISLHQQLNLMLRVTETIGNIDGIQLSTFTQLNKGIRKATRRQLNKLFGADAKNKDIAKNPLVEALYCRSSRMNASNDDHLGTRLRNEAEGEDTSTTGGGEVPLLQEARARIKDMFWTLAQKERHAQEHLDGYQIAPLEAMNSRRDVVRSDHAHEYMLTLGYLGEFEEMGRLLEWLIHQWGDMDVVSALSEMDEPPPYADFFETLCVFRLVAEPMLGNERVSMLLQTMADSRLGWTWPDDEAVEAYADIHDDESIKILRRAVELARDANKAQASRHTMA